MYGNAFLGPRLNWFREREGGLALDIAETEDEFVVKASIPGINPDDLEVTYDNNMLTIKGEVKEEKEMDEDQYHLRERRYGSIFRSVSIPSVNVDEIEATYDAGVLTLHLPKVEEAKPKKIEITGASKVIEGKAKAVTNKK
jgi:HSP20 family protein